MKRRRVVICATAGWLARTAHAAGATPHAQMRRIGVVSPSTGRGGELFVKELEERLRGLGYMAGVNVVYDVRFPGLGTERLRNAAAELVAAQSDVIVVLGGVRAALQGISTQIPIVALSDDLVGTGFAQSLARPGGNVTGVTIASPELVPKRLQLLKEAVPQLQRVTVMSCPFQRAALPGLQAVAQELGVMLLPVTINSTQGAMATVAGMKTSNTHGLLVLDCTFNNAIATMVPASYFHARHVHQGALMSYAHHGPDTARMIAGYVDRILKGAKPADLPIQQPTRFRLIINVKTARALGITIPQSLLLRADEVIQ